MSASTVTVTVEAILVHNADAARMLGICEKTFLAAARHFKCTPVVQQNRCTLWKPLDIAKLANAIEKAGYIPTAGTSRKTQQMFHVEQSGGSKA